MIEKIYIPTYKRVGKQKTFFNLPEKYQKITTLVVREEEAELHGDLPITIIDNQVSNVAETRLFANSSSADSVSGGGVGRVDFLSNGFKARDSHQDGNSSSGTYIYFAFAKSPFKNSRAR